MQDVYKRQPSRHSLLNKLKTQWISQCSSHKSNSTAVREHDIKCHDIKHIKFFITVAKFIALQHILSTFSSMECNVIACSHNLTWPHGQYCRTETTVSYTHLDVYKRQASELLENYVEQKNSINKDEYVIKECFIIVQFYK